MSTRYVLSMLVVPYSEFESLLAGGRFSEVTVGDTTETRVHRVTEAELAALGGAALERAA